MVDNRRMQRNVERDTGLTVLDPHDFADKCLKSRQPHENALANLHWGGCDYAASSNRQVLKHGAEASLARRAHRRAYRNLMARMATAIHGWGRHDADLAYHVQHDALWVPHQG